MNNLEQQIEEAAGNLLQYLIPDINKATLHQHKNAVAAITLTMKSQAVRAYHTQGMYSNKQLIEALESFGKQVCRELIGSELEMIGEINNWFEQNKKK